MYDDDNDGGLRYHQTMGARMNEQQQDNLAVWKQFEETDPRYTKKFQRAGGFSGTATNATYLVKKATEAWGPVGGRWGYEVMDEKFVDGAAWTGDLQGHGHDIVHILRLRLRHPDGMVEHFGQTMFVGRNSKGPFTDEEAPKKSLTDALTKCLSMLGFNADVYLGLYDDNKYVSDLQAKFEEEEKDGTGNPGVRGAAGGAKGAVQAAAGADPAPNLVFLRALEEAAAKGITAYRAVWEHASPQERVSCAKRHELLKEIALKASSEEEKKAYVAAAPRKK